MKVLIVGGGGREHALAWACARSTRVREVLVAPGNAGTETEPKVRNVAVAPEDIGGLLRLAQSEQPALTIIGPEAPLVAGITDAFAAAGLSCFGPDKACAQLEGSKAFAKAFLERHGIPTAAYRRFTHATYDAAWVKGQRAPIVVKASGLASGKGVVIADSAGEADAVARAMLSGSHGRAGAEVVIEEFLPGEEASFILIADGEHALPLASSQDHKRLREADQGPNTGGMGAYSPAPVLTEALHARVMREIVTPTLVGLSEAGTPYTGFLYVGLMVGPDGAPRVLEFNCRLGDPEAQPLLMRLRSDLTELCEAALEHRLARAAAQWDSGSALGVVLAAPGYPDRPQLGQPIEGLEAAAQLPGKVFHAGTRRVGGRIVTTGGRVLCAVGRGTPVSQAQREAYALVERIHFPGMQYRRDIGQRAIERERV